MHAWESIQVTLDFIEEHLEEKISIEELAKKANLSEFYYQRLFKRLVNKPVMEYVKLRRLASAADDLAKNKNRILDTALGLGFDNHETFTRAFKKAYGLTPEEYRAAPVGLNQFVKPDLLLNYVMVDENVPLITDGIILEISRRMLDVPKTFIGIAGEIPIEQLMGGETTGIASAGKLWDKFHREKGKIPHLIPDGNEFGALYMGDAKEGYCTYMAGAEAEPGAYTGGYDTFVLPAAEYLICGFEAETLSELVNSAIFKADKFMERWLKSHKLMSIADFAIEMYYPVTPEAAYLEHWIIPGPIDQE